MSSEEASQNPAAVESLSAVADAVTLLSSKEVLSLKMSSEEPSQNPAAAVESGEKQLTKKELAKLERKHKRQEAAAPALSAVAADDPLAANYGEIPVEELQSKEVTGRKWTEVKKLTVELEGTAVLIRGHAQAIRAVGKKMAFVVVRRSGFSVQCVLTVAPDLVSPQMVKFATALSKESIVDVEGIVALPSQPITGAVTQQQVEIQVRKFYCVDKAIPMLPINIEDAARSEAEIDEALQEGKQAVQLIKEYLNSSVKLRMQV